MLALLIVLLIILVLHYAVPMGAKILLRRQFLGLASRSPYVFLTFDDGPNPHATPAILDLLKTYNAKATFFLIGSQAEKLPHLVRRIRDEGHLVGDHSYSHSHAWKSDPFTTALDLTRGSSALASLGQKPPRFFRPPFGKFNLASLIYMVMRQNIAVFWNVDPEDYAQMNGSVVAAHVIQRMSPGAVILLHDGSYNSDRTAENTVEALKAILEAGKARGCTFATIEALYPAGES